MRRIPGLSAKSLITFAQEAVEPGSVVHSDAWLGNVTVESKRYIHEVTFLRGNPKSPSDLPPRVHRVVSLLKRWLLGTHQGAIGHEYLHYYLDEFTFRFNRRFSQPGQTLLPFPSTGACGSRPCHTSRWSRRHERGATAICWRHVSELRTP